MSRETMLHSLNTTPQEALIKNLESIRDSINTVLLYQRSLSRVEDRILLSKVFKTVKTTLSQLEKGTEFSQETLINNLEFIRVSIDTILKYQRSLSRAEDRIRLNTVLETVTNDLSRFKKCSKPINRTSQVTHNNEQTL